jgi:hypothetical protein
MTAVGMWLAIVGYGLVYSGMIQLSGRTCSIIDAFTGKCGGVTTASVTTSGTTQQSQLLAAQAQQQSVIGTQPIAQGTV